MDLEFLVEEEEEGLKEFGDAVLEGFFASCIIPMRERIAQGPKKSPINEGGKAAGTAADVLLGIACLSYLINESNPWPLIIYGGIKLAINMAIYFFEGVYEHNMQLSTINQQEPLPGSISNPALY